MAPALAVLSETAAETAKSAAKSFQKKPLELKGVLDAFDSFDVTPVIGKEFPTANLKEWLQAPNSDELLADLAITSEFLRTHPCFYY
jgi:hypothetical protein